MLNVALTGNIASGKSTVAAWFEAWGATIIDSDQLVAEVQQPGSEALDVLARRFGREIIREDGSLDRAELREIAFSNEDSLRILNSVIHPLVQARRTELVAEALRRGDRVLVSDIPLLFEVLDPGDFDLVVLVESPKPIRRIRLTERGVDVAEADRIIDSQMPSEEKRNRADIIIENCGSMDELEAAAKAAWTQILKAAEETSGSVN